jgi:hypothetical protein
MSERRIQLGDLMASLLLAALLLTGCGGTEAGNPTLNRTNNAERIYLTQELLTVACLKLEECTTVTAADCQAGTKPLSGFAEAIGATGFASLQAAIDAERAGSITGNLILAVTCQSEVGSLACASAEVTSAWSAASPGDFSNVRNLIPASSTSCPGIF